MSFQAVVFDMDGVIFDSEAKVVECWQVVAKKYGIPDIEDACRHCLGINRDATRAYMLEAYGQDFPYDEYKTEMSALFHERYGDGRLPLKAGVREILPWLKENDIKIALASSTRRAIVEAELKAAGLYDFFDKVICGDMVEKSKPAPDIFLKACNELGIKPCNAYAIEDSYNGIRSAHGAGLNCIMVPDLAPATEEMRKLSEQILPDLVAVKEYFSIDT
ncbi:MAG: HAD family phosphatase [Clostridium sp.]|nr:HAD family phosphatase [Clostridium sp.]MCM1209817.1 HAD family phosphatase [Ruminococcus sp.]